MKIPPLLAASALLLVGVMAFCATAVIERGRARARRPAPEPEVEDALPAPRHFEVSVGAPRVRATPPAPVVAPEAELHVHVSGPHGIAVDGLRVSAHRRGDDDDDRVDLEEDDGEGAAAGTFSASELAPGRYDLRIEGAGMRTVQVDDAAPGAQVIAVELARAPVLLGAVGPLGAPGCADVELAWSGPGDEGGEAPVDPDDCTFAAEGLPDSGTITVVASRGARRETALVMVPLSGDPGFLCLAPPCASAPASVLVYVADTDHRQVDDATLTWTLQGDGLEGAMGSAMGTGVIFVHGRRPGQTLLLRAERGDDASETTTLVGAGITEAVLTLPAPEPDDSDDAAELRPRAARRIRLDDGEAADLPSPASARERVLLLR